MPCVKRHKQWAQCSGKRDPTKYVKKSQLATPAGIDHDYNFLSGIERDMEKSEKSITEKGLVGLNARPKGDQAQRMDYQFAQAGVKVIRAPKGMSRAKENKTHRSKSGNKNIIWTVEWIGEDKNRTLTQCSAVEPIYRIHPLFESPSLRKKRKREAEALLNTNPESNQVTQTVDESQSVARPLSPQPSDSPAPNEHDTPVIKAEAVRSEPTQPEIAADKGYKFYILRPRTSSSRRVLIPLTASDTLGDALRGCTVEEFPTIYYFPSTISELPQEFMLDDDYRKEEGEQQREFDELMKDVDPEILRRLRDDGTGSKTDEEVDSKKILDVLKQDLGGL